MPRLPGFLRKPGLRGFLVGEDLEVFGVSDLLVRVNIDPDCHLTIVAALAACLCLLQSGFARRQLYKRRPQLTQIRAGAAKYDRNSGGAVLGPSRLTRMATARS
jgi:hypothetical protein